MGQHLNGVAVVVVPLAAQGHLNQCLHLSRIISLRGIPVHYIGSATHNLQVRDRVHGWDPCTNSNIHFHDFQLPEFLNPPPDPHAINNFPTHLLPTFAAAAFHLREALGVLLRALSSSNRRVVVVHDGLTSFAAHEASFVSNAEAYCFDAASAFTVLHVETGVLGLQAHEEYIMESYFSEDGGLIEHDVMPGIRFADCFFDGFSEFVTQHFQWLSYRAGDIFNTCNAIEEKFINKLAQRQSDKKLWAIGPLNPVALDSTAGTTQHKCLQWLHKQPPRSVLYVSFGTMTSITDDQILELAIGLERSEQRFIWVLRDADRGDIYKDEATEKQLPSGYEERIKGVGMIVRDWAPQLQILAHASTGGFLSHCGWNSCMESLSMGVPIATWPMHSDQPGNALLVTKVLKVGLVVRDWAHRDQLVSSSTIESSIKKLMASDEGYTMRKRAIELGIEVRRAMSDGGTSTAQLESFITHISR